MGPLDIKKKVQQKERAPRYIVQFLKPTPIWASLFQGLEMLMRVPSMNLLEPWNWGIYKINQATLFFNSRPLDLVNNGGINVGCNKNVIIIKSTLIPIPQENVIHGVQTYEHELQLPHLIYSLIIIIIARMLTSVRCKLFKISKMKHLTMFLPYKNIEKL